MADLDALLIKTSRTFALAIPLLPAETRQEVTVAYLLFRIADTFEDATEWPARRQEQALADLGRMLHEPPGARAEEVARGWLHEPPLQHEGYLELLGETPAVVEALHALRPASRRAIADHLQRTIDGMAAYVRRRDSNRRLQLADLSELRDYCYVVAGIVGEMLTALFLLGEGELRAVEAELGARARYFGEGLQLTNILKDSASDETEGRSYVPATVSRYDVYALAREDLRRAEEYVQALQRAGACRGVVAFNALPVSLAWATLDRVESEGPGAKLTRPEVMNLLQQLDDALENGLPVLSHA